MNLEYGFGFKLAETWKDRVEISEESLSKDGLYRVDFIYKPADKNLKEVKLLSIKIREKDDSKLAKDEYELMDGDYKYTAIYYNLKDNPYKNNIEEDNFKIVNQALDGIEDLFMILDNVEENKYTNDKYKFSFILPPAWKNHVRVKENSNPEKGLFQVDFIFTPENKKDASFNFFTISVRNLEDKAINDIEGVLAEGNYLYVGQYKAMKKLPYKKDSKSQEEFIKVNDVLNGAEELIKIDELNLELKDMKKIIINGKILDLKDSIYINENGRPMLPLREIGEKIGFNISWNKAGRVAELEKLPITAGVYVGENKNYFLNALIDLEDKSELVKGKTYVPATFFAEVLGGLIDLNKDGMLELEY